MRIINEEQLDFDDLLIMPKSPDKHKKLVSRSQVVLEREFKWYDSTDSKKFTLSCIPYGTSNMGTVGTCKMARLFVLSGHIACLEKHTRKEEIEALFAELKQKANEEGKADDFYYSKVIPSIGLKEDPQVLFELYDKWHYSMLMIDVPNGYIQTLLDRIQLFSTRCPDLFIIAGNVVTADGAKDILNAGAKCVKAGIGNGCFTGQMKVLTSAGLKKIRDIEIGDRVLTHTGSFEKVVNKFTFSSHKKVMKVNGIECTPNHKFYVAKAEDVDKLTDSNYQEFCFWVEAKDLDRKVHKLVKLNDCALEILAAETSEIYDNDRKTFDLEVENSHSYNIEGIIVHNSVCSTRLKTGVGRPQASTLIEIADAVHQFGCYCMCDGGVANPGEVCKAFGCGADFIISGSLFAGCNEADGDVVEVDGKKFKQYYGMSSYLAQQKHFGGIRKYSASEGREKLIPCTGSVEDALQEIDGGIRSACTYIGCDKMKSFSRQCTFYKVHKQLNMHFASCQDIKRS